MSLPNNYRKNADGIGANSSAGVPSFDLSTQAFAQPTYYVLRLFARLGAGTAEAVTVSHNFWIDDGFGDAERLVTLTTSLASGLQTDAYQLLYGVGLSVRVRCETLTSTSVVNARAVLVSAALAQVDR